MRFFSALVPSWAQSVFFAALFALFAFTLLPAPGLAETTYSNVFSLRAFFPEEEPVAAQTLEAPDLPKATFFYPHRCVFHGMDAETDYVTIETCPGGEGVPVLMAGQSQETRAYYLQVDFSLYSLRDTQHNAAPLNMAPSAWGWRYSPSDALHDFVSTGVSHWGFGDAFRPEAAGGSLQVVYKQELSYYHIYFLPKAGSAGSLDRLTLVAGSALRLEGLNSRNSPVAKLTPEEQALFEGWMPAPSSAGVDLSNIQTCVLLVPMYDAGYTVQFLDGQGALYQTLSVASGKPIPLASVTPPEKTGLRFSHWADGQGTPVDAATPVGQSLTLFPVYKAIVSFYNGGQLYAQRTVLEGEYLTEMPDAPVGTGGRVFVGWDEDVQTWPIYWDTTVYAQYALTITFRYGLSGEHLRTEILYPGGYVAPPDASVPAYRYDWNPDIWESPPTVPTTVTAAYTRLPSAQATSGAPSEEEDEGEEDTAQVPVDEEDDFADTQYIVDGDGAVGVTSEASWEAIFLALEADGLYGLDDGEVPLYGRMPNLGMATGAVLSCYE